MVNYLDGTNTMSILSTLATRSGASQVSESSMFTEIFFSSHADAMEFRHYIKTKQYIIIAGPTSIIINDNQYYIITVGHREIVYNDK